MRPLHTLVIALALLAAGAAAWLFVAGVEDPASAALPASAEPGQAGNAPPGAALTALPERSPEVGSEGGGDRARVAFDAPPGPSASSPPPRGGATLVVGRVLDTEGRGVAGATVLAAPGGVFGPAAMPLDAPAPGGTLLHTTRFEATTDPEGRFELGGLSAGSLRIAVRAKGFAPHDDDGLALPAGETTELEGIVLEPGVVVSGRVVDRLGRGVAGAEIQRLARAPRGFGPAFAFMAGVPLATTDAGGGFQVDQLASGAWSLRVTSEDHPDHVEQGTARRPGERIEGLVIALEDGFEIEGRAVGLPESARETLSVRAVAAGGDGDAPRAGRTSDFGMREAAVQEDGSFLLRGLRGETTYALTLRRARSGAGLPAFFSPALSPEVRARAGERGVRLPYEPEAAILLQVVDARTREPLERFQVQAGIDWPVPLLGDDGRVVLRHPGGRVRFGNLRPGSSLDRATLAIDAVGYRSWRRDDLALAPGAELDLGVVALEPAPMVEIAVVDAGSGEPVAGARVTLRREAGGRGRFSMRMPGDEEDGPVADGSMQRARTDGSGVARLSGFDGAPCVLSVEHGDYAPHRSEPFVPSPAAGRREVRLSPGGTVLVRLLDSKGEPVAGARIEHRPPGEEDGLWFADLEGSGQDVTDARGEARFEHLAPGLHRFRPRDPDSGGFFRSPSGDAFALRIRGSRGGPQAESWEEVAVAEGAAAELVLALPERAVLHGRVREGGQPLAGATVQLAGEGGGAGLSLASGPTALTDGEGRYELEGVAPGEAALVVSHPDRHMEARFPIEVRGGEQRFDLELSIAVLEGRVTDEHGEPVAGARVWPERAPSGGTSARTTTVMSFVSMAGPGGASSSFTVGPAGATTRATTDEDGRYVLRGVEAGVDLVVRADAARMQPGRSEPVRVAPDGLRRGVDLVLRAGGEIEVEALRPDGSPGRRLLVRASFEGEEPSGVMPATAFISDGGRTVLEGLAPGPWRVSLETFGRRDSGGEIEPKTATVRAGERSRLRFDVP